MQILIILFIIIIILVLVPLELPFWSPQVFIFFIFFYLVSDHFVQNMMSNLLIKKKRKIKKQILATWVLVERMNVPSIYIYINITFINGRMLMSLVCQFQSDWRFA